MIAKIHTFDFTGLYDMPWPPDADFPAPAQDLDALYEVACVAYDAYMEAASKWARDKEPLRLQAWKEYHERLGWPKMAGYRENIEAKLARYVPAEEEENKDVQVG